MIDEIELYDDDKRNEITFLLASLKTKGLPHYDRSMLASRISKLVKEYFCEKLDRIKNEKTEESDRIPF